MAVSLPQILESGLDVLTMLRHNFAEISLVLEMSSYIMLDNLNYCITFVQEEVLNRHLALYYNKEDHKLIFCYFYAKLKPNPFLTLQ